MGMHYIAFPSYEFESFEMDDTLVGENPSPSTISKFPESDENTMFGSHQGTTLIRN